MSKFKFFSTFRPKMKSSKFFVFALVMFLGITPLLVENPAHAASVEFTDSVDDQLNKTATSAGGTQKARITKQYNDFSSQYKGIISWDDKISSLHYENEAQVSTVRKQIKEINDDKITKLETQVKELKSKYQPLFDSYSSLTRQVAAAKKLKDKSLYKVLSVQADVMRTAATLARQEIRTKQDSLTAAKKDKTNLAKKIRGVLAEIDPVKNKIKAEKSVLSGQSKLITTEWTNFKAAIKKSDADRTSDALARLLTLSTKANSLKQNIYSMEVSIGNIIKRSKALLP
ncbi:hypothetical protein D3C74_163810 [compost metagenome]